MSNAPIRVAIAGAAGRMGREAARALSLAEGIEVVVAVDRHGVGESARTFTGPDGPDIHIEGALDAALGRTPCDVLLELTHPDSALAHVECALRRGVAPVVGTSGIDDASLRRIADLCDTSHTPALVVPNFALGAVLMMRFAEMAARWMPHVEIVELHHDHKADAPSGTAMLTARRVDAARRGRPAHGVEVLKAEGARGADVCGVPVHSVRLPGLVAHQRVLFGGAGETLTIAHDSLERSSFMDGITLCVRQVRSLRGLVVGMDSLRFGDGAPHD